MAIFRCHGRMENSREKRRFGMGGKDEKDKGLSFYRRRKKVNAAILAEVLKYIAGIAISIFLAVVIVWLFGCGPGSSECPWSRRS